MADVKITALTAISANPVNPATFPMPMVDLLDTSMAASGTTKKVTVNQILGAGGTATLASATITGAATVGTTLGVTGNLTVDTDVLKVDTTNNRVGIGTASPAVICDVTAAEADIAIFRSTGGGGNDKRLTITSGGDRIILNASNNTNTATAQAYAFQSAGTEVGRINTTGVYVLAGGTTTANGVGVAFPSTQSASSDANCLDDYEEGTFLPTITAETGTIGTTVVNSANYTKVGRLVSVTFDITITTVGTGAAGLKVSMPFSPSVAGNTCGALREYQVTGNMGQVYKYDATNVLCNSYNNSTLIVANYRIMAGYTYYV